MNIDDRHGEEDALDDASYPVQRPDEAEHHRGEADDAEHCEEICHEGSMTNWPVTAR